MAFDAFALMLAMLALGMAFARTNLLPTNAAEVLKRELASNVLEVNLKAFQLGRAAVEG